MLGAIALILCLILFSKIGTLTKEIEGLKRQTGISLTGLDKNVSAGAQAVSHATPQVSNPVTTPIAPTPPSYAQTVPSVESNFEKWIKEDFFVKLGALLLLIGFGWFVSYAFAHQWIGPVGRITLGIFAGVAIIAFGTWRMRTFTHQGSIFLVLGSTTVLLTVFAARELYDFFTPTTALALMFLTVAFVAYVSVVYKNQNLALASLILASIAPFFTNAPTPDIAGLFTYLLLVVLGTLWVVYLTGSHVLTFTALLIVALYGAPFALGSLLGGERDIALLFAFIFTAIFFASNIISILRQKSGEILQAHLAIAFGTGVYLIMWILVASPKEFQSLLFSAWMLVFALGSFVVYKQSSHRAPFYIYSAISVGLLGAATAAELDGPLLTIAFTIEAGIIVLLARFLTDNVNIVQKMSLLFSVPVILSFGSMVSPSWYEGFLHGDFFVLGILSLTLLAVGISLLKKNEGGEGVPMNMVLLFVVPGVTYILVLIWLVLHSLFSPDVATIFSLVIFAIIGFVLFINGRMKDEKMTRVAGALLLGFVVVHLMLIDVWQMALTGRIITFFAIGALLMSTAFIKPRHTQDNLETSNTPS